MRILEMSNLVVFLKIDKSELLPVVKESTKIP